jgi:hypothetical protein
MPVGAFGRFWPLRLLVARLNLAVEIRWQTAANHVVLATLMSACPASPGFCPPMSVLARTSKTPLFFDFLLVAAPESEGPCLPASIVVNGCFGRHSRPRLTCL